jgi:predicted aspartyl protease
MSGPFPYHLREMPPYPGASVSVSWGNHYEQCWAVIDTGSNHTIIPAWLVGALHLRRLNDEVDVSGPQMLTEKQSLYAANLAFLGLTFDAHPVVPLGWPEILIGRDIINKWVLTLDGPKQTFFIR